MLLVSSALNILVSTASASVSTQAEVPYHPQDVAEETTNPDCVAEDGSCYWNDPDEAEEEDYADEISDLPEKHVKQKHNNTHKDRGDSGLKKATKDTDSGVEDEQLLKWLSDKAVPEATSCGVYLAPSTIPGAGLGMFAGQAYNRNDIVTQGDIIIPLSELDWHNGFQIDFFLWEEYTWSASSFVGMEEENG